MVPMEGAEPGEDGRMVGGSLFNCMFFVHFVVK